MRSLLWFLGVLGRALVAIFSGVLDRLRRGPADPGWTFGRELMMAGMRAVLRDLAALPPERQKALNDSSRGDVPRSYRALVSRVPTGLAGRKTDEFEPRGMAKQAASATVLYFHGGGYAFGSLESYRAYAARMVLATGARVLLPDYRLSTEAPFPAALDDAEACYLELLEQGVAPETLFVGGESAGGGLTLALLLRLRDAGKPQPAGAFVISPWADLSGTGSTLRSNAASDYLTAEALVAWARLYVRGEDTANPLISPVLGDYHDIAPLLVQVGAVEILRSDSDLLVEAIRKADGDVSYEVYDHMPHAWQLIFRGSPETQLAWHRVGDFVRSRLPAASPAG